jgi:AmiR/NasT family two-component response regulator
MAKGIMIALHGVDPDTAFEMLRRESQRSHTKLSEVAKRLITTTITRPSPPTS